MADIGLPNLEIIFKGLGTSAIKRGIKGTAVLIIKDDTDKTFDFKEYRSVADLTSEQLALYTDKNIQYIKDCFMGTPLKIIVARMDSTDGVFADLLKKIKGKIPRNCWIGLAEGSTAEQDSLVSFVKSEVKNNQKRYKVLAYKATVTDDIHIVNLTTDKVTFKGDRGEQDANQAISYLLGVYAGLTLDMSAIAIPLQLLESVSEVDDLEALINKGELVLTNDEGEVKIARSINSLITTGQGVTDDMKFVIIVESMDLIYTDIHYTWNKFYKGKYKNKLQNQLLLISAITAYFEGLESDSILDENYDNKTEIDIEAQRLLNYSKYGKETVDSWDDKKAMSMTYGTNVVFSADTKILNAMEDFKFKIAM
ncbi:MAG: phage tail sheath C-terminal domain-containing protein [Psychrilyobacter sp.]|uniref:phage tail sheath C-terminal domain-containing protein n=1 Tax=Psychrilyobacter sp. TaxID=2586924 RepID=UPI003C793852